MSVSVWKILDGGPCLGIPSGRHDPTGSSRFVHWSSAITLSQYCGLYIGWFMPRREVDMNTQSSLWFVHSMQFFDWNGVHRLNMSPTVQPVPWTPEPVILPPACQEPVRSGFPLGSLGVGAFGSGAAAPPPRPKPPCAANPEPMTARIAAVHARSRAPVIRSLIAVLT